MRQVLVLVVVVSRESEKACAQRGLQTCASLVMLSMTNSIGKSADEHPQVPAQLLETRLGSVV